MTEGDDQGPPRNAPLALSVALPLNLHSQNGLKMHTFSSSFSYPFRRAFTDLFSNEALVETPKGSREVQ